MVNNIDIYLGLYDDLEIAKQARTNAEIKYQGEYRYDKNIDRSDTNG